MRCGVAPPPREDGSDELTTPRDGDACVEEEEPDCEAADNFYRHPLQGLEQVDGLYPFIDLHHSPTGKVYAMAQGGYGTEDGDEIELDHGVVELDRREITDEERAAVEATRPDVDESVYVHDKLGPELREAVELAEATDQLDTAQLDVAIRLERDLVGSVNTRMHRAIAEGRVQTQEDRDVVRAEIMADIADHTAAKLAPVLELLAAEGIEPSFVGTVHPRIQAIVSPAFALELEAREDIVRIDLDRAPVEGAANGQQEAEAQQFRLNWDLGYICGLAGFNYDGQPNCSTAIRAAVVELSQFRDEHVAFRDGSSATPSRIKEMWDCEGACTQVSAGDWTPPSGEHGTSVLGALFGDYRDAQDSNVTTASAREQRSAAAGEAEAYLYDIDTIGGDMGKVLDHVATRSPAPHLLSSSLGIPKPATMGQCNADIGDCNGDTTLDSDIDDLFEDGIAAFWLAGNDYEDPPMSEDWDCEGISGDAGNCTVWDGGDAIGAFTVGAYDPVNGDPCIMRNFVHEVQSAWGGSTTNVNEGRFRSIVDVTANWSGAATPSSGNNTSTNGFNGTSNATPTAASAAIAFIDMMKTVHGNAIDDPGYLYAWMLNNADRYAASGGPKTSGYDHRMGAGRLNLRFISPAGLDAPYFWYHWEVCVDHNQTVTLNINGGNAISGDIESARATAWWYDRRFHNGTALDNVNLYLRETDGTTLRSSQSFSDNKERVYHADVGGRAIKLELHGFSVTADNEGCGTNSMRVWVTLLVEDDDRDDANGPEWDDLDCLGVQTL